MNTTRSTNDATAVLYSTNKLNIHAVVSDLTSTEYILIQLDITCEPRKKVLA